MDIGNYTGKKCKPHWEAIFKKMDIDDTKRFQWKVYEEEMKSLVELGRISKDVQRLVASIFPDYQWTYPVSVLKSLARGVDQQPHCDFDEDDEKFSEYRPFACVVSVTGNSFLNVDVDGSVSRSIELDAGDLILFTGKHGGCSYPILNLRLHYYFTHASLAYEDYSLHTHF